MRKKSLQEEMCPMARSVEAVGDWWSLLIVRDAYAGIRRFSDFQRSLGIAKNILSSRLKALVALSVLRVETTKRGHREYVLTEKGAELRPILDALSLWGRNHLFSDDELAQLDVVMREKRLTQRERSSA